jgi:ATP-dependent RNA helicase SUPV3L1/SUV3
VVRIDMLERLADLIRDRVFWKPRFPDEPRPAGSIEGGGFTVVPDMMSLVGCSGEEFQGILKSLNFRVQKKAVTREAVVLPAVAEPAVTEPASTAPDDAPAPPPPDSEPLTLDAVTETGAALPSAPPTETVEIDIWWPKDTGPFRHKAKQTKQPKPRGQEKPRGQQKPRPQRVEREAPKPAFERPRRPEKPVDPNSPFAVLGQLKAQMAGQKR